MMGRLLHILRLRERTCNCSSRNISAVASCLKFLAGRRDLCLIIMLLACTNLQAQQKAMYTQYMFNGLALNPAYSATDEALTITSLYRQQWVGLKGAPNTQTLSIHTPVGESNTSVGASIIRDQIGEVITEKGVYLTVAQRVPVGEQSYLAVGFNGGLSSYSAEYSMNYAGSPQSTTDPVFEDQSQMRANFGLGVVFFGPKYYVGLSSPHFYYRPLGEISNLASSTTYRPHYILQGGYIAELSDMIKFKPHLIINYVNGSPVLIDMNASVLFAERLWLGGSYRSKDAFNAIAQLYVLPTLAVGYSYDFTSTKLSRIEKGSHEISLKFRIPVKGRDFPQCYF